MKAEPNMPKLRFRSCVKAKESIKDLNQLNFDHLIMIMNFKLPELRHLEVDDQFKPLFQFKKFTIRY
ncbi:hypothetical protein BpHYR1_040565 [Brachionus plicatilis]|uniref:Uncharacterized protein n=1 Tax=Brachionus plicatilis TaxID=10195 RepID=A0A3M7PLS6_BRAPC|nr:hypothetical protein BpHYR1_040565 [Brachionus plicatilis]